MQAGFHFGLALWMFLIAHHSMHRNEAGWTAGGAVLGIANMMFAFHYLK